MPEPSLPTAIIVIPIVLAMLMVCLVMIKPSILKDGGGQIVGFCALFLLPISVGLMGGLIQSDQAQTTEYCLSCHIMDDWGKSLHVDDNEFVPADHFQNYLVPQDRSCYVCHSDQVWYGGITAKIRGLKHVYVQYIGDTPEPKDIKLYDPYHNRECLQCHQGARSYEESRHHRKEADMLTRINTNVLSCMESKCHDIQHNIEELDDYEPDEFWQETTN
ncbi:MAG TPA: hypothetical protein DIT99_07160 [Candidatus Latescibacteria bacterium]|jgi:nitrate/TMAO reductase-like tetraheme cytochrome c subunit|nr:hypothetical protein [Candidatus Latescibacterota bacterium]